MEQVKVIRVAPTTFLDELGNPVEGFKVIFAVDDLPDQFFLNVRKSEASKDKVQELIHAEAIRIRDLHQMEF